MKRARLFLTGVVCAGISGIVLSGSVSIAHAAPATEKDTQDNHQIKVSLFGQPCVLEGPMGEGVLKSIHAISPEQLYPTFEPGETADSAKKALEKLHATKDLPSAFDTYREGLGKRLEAEFAFLNRIVSAHRDDRADLLLADAKKFIPEAKQKNFETIAMKLEAKDIPHPQKKQVVQELFDFYGDAIPAAPEEEFHRAIHQLKVQYVCAFEENEAPAAGPSGSTGSTQ
jgi:hypothetical protein